MNIIFIKTCNVRVKNSIIFIQFPYIICEFEGDILDSYLRISAVAPPSSAGKLDK